MKPAATNPGQINGSSAKTFMIACTMASTVINPRNPSPVSHMSLACSGWYFPDILQPFCLALDATGGKACNDAVLENEHHDNQRDGHQRSCCHGCGIGVFECRGARKARDGHGHRLSCGSGELARKHELIPRGDKRDNRSRKQCWCGKW